MTNIGEMSREPMVDKAAMVDLGSPEFQALQVELDQAWAGFDFDNLPPAYREKIEYLGEKRPLNQMIWFTEATRADFAWRGPVLAKIHYEVLEHGKGVADLPIERISGLDLKTGTAYLKIEDDGKIVDYPADLMFLRPDPNGPRTVIEEEDEEGWQERIKQDGEPPERFKGEELLNIETYSPTESRGSYGDPIFRHISRENPID